MLNYGMKSDRVIQTLLSNTYDALRQYHEILIEQGIMSLHYDGNGIYIYFMGKVFYLKLQEAEAEAETKTET